jgi:DNA-directed RNA polymerase specialized sigma24 family protein
MKRDEMDDNDLVRECLQGNLESYRHLMDRYGDYVMAVALNILMNYEDAQDACQEAFLKAFRNLEKFDLQKSFKNWFYSLFYNSCLDHLRKRKRFFNMLGKFRIEAGTGDFLGSPNPASPQWQEFKLLQKLSPKERITIYLWSQEGYTGSEIASVLGCSHKTAHVYLYKAREKLKALLKEKRNGKL